jgi:hypothetical protein
LPSPIIRDSNSIGVNNFAIHTVILYFTASTDKPTLDQIYIAGGHLGGGGGAGNDGSDGGRRRRRRAGAAGRQAAASALSSGRRGVGEEEAVCRGIGFGRSLLPIVLTVGYAVSLNNQKRQNVSKMGS